MWDFENYARLLSNVCNYQFEHVAQHFKDACCSQNVKNNVGFEKRMRL